MRSSYLPAIFLGVMLAVAACAPSDPACRAVYDTHKLLKARAANLSFPSSADRTFISECGDLGGALGARHLSGRAQTDAMVACYRVNCETSSSGRYCSEKEDLLNDLMALVERKLRNNCSVDVSL